MMPWRLFELEMAANPKSTNFTLASSLSASIMKFSGLISLMKETYFKKSFFTHDNDKPVNNIMIVAMLDSSQYLLAQIACISFIVILLL